MIFHYQADLILYVLTRYETDTSNFDPIDPDKLRPENEERWAEDFILYIPVSI